MAYNTAEFLTDLKNHAYFPASQTNLTDAVLLNFADDEFFMSIAPNLKSFNENYYLEKEDFSFTAGQGTYTLPRWGMWNAPFIVQRLDANSNPQYPDFVRIEIDQLKDYPLNVQAPPLGYYILNDTINFVPIPGSTVTDRFRIWHYRRPGKMVPLASAAQVLSVVAGLVTYTAAPPATYTATSRHDSYSATSPFRRLMANIQATAQAGATQTFPAADVATLQPGDWVNVVDETVIPPVPIELWSWLKELVILSIAETQIDPTVYQMKLKSTQDGLKAAMQGGGNRQVGRQKRLSLGSHQLVRGYGRRYW